MIRDPERRRERQRVATARWRARHPERALESSRESDRRRDPAKKVAKWARWYARRGDAFNARRRAKYAADPEPILAVNRASYARHREKRAADARAYRRKLKEEANGRL